MGGTGRGDPRPGGPGRLTPELAEANAQADLDEQARLFRIAARREARVNAPEDAAHAFEQAVARVGPEWSQLIQNRPTWRQAMHKARTDENLSPEHGRRICEAWDSDAVGGVSAGQPARSKIWGGWSSDAEWRRKAAGLGPTMTRHAHRSSVLGEAEIVPFTPLAARGTA